MSLNPTPEIFWFAWLIDIQICGRGWTILNNLIKI